MASSYPFLSKALGVEVEDGGCFDPTDPSVQKSMCSLLRESNALLSTTYEFNTTDMSNNKICYVRVPRTSSNSSFHNSKEWLDTAIQIPGSKQNDTLRNLHWGLGDKMEDWVERLHQWGMQQRRQFRTVQNPLVRMNA